MEITSFAAASATKDAGTKPVAGQRPSAYGPWLSVVLCASSGWLARQTMPRLQWLSRYGQRAIAKEPCPAQHLADDAAAARDRQRDQFSIVAGSKGQCLTGSHRAALKLAEPPHGRTACVLGALPMLSATAARRPPTAKKCRRCGRFCARVLVACVDLHLTCPIHKRARRCHQKEPRRRFENPFGGDRRDLDNMAGKAILD